MRASQLYAPTLRETPAEAEIVSHQLMLRAGMIRKAAGGIYTYLPLAWRVLKKIEAIVRQEMDAKDGQELLMPIVQPAELWKETGRWDVYGDEMFRLQDRHGRDFCLGPTHEEMITTVVKTDVRSYRQLPLMLYQIQNKYRDEIRPRFGLMRGREFIMKDAYSFDRNEEGLSKSYLDMYDAYSRIFARCGLAYRAVEADSGAIGGSGSHEFMVVAETGEDAIVYCSACDFAANVEKAELLPLPADREEPQPLQSVATPQARSIEQVAALLAVPPSRLIKTVAYETDKGLVVALMRGDHQVNETKLKNELGCLTIAMAGEEAVQSAGSHPGFLGPVNLTGFTIAADATVMHMMNAVCGANQLDMHLINVNPSRDVKPDIVADLRLIREDDPCPRCNQQVKMARGIEVGHIFKLRTKYSTSLKATFLDENGQEQPMIMGCYGIGISRTMAAAIEQNFDKDGIIWPVPIAPYHAVIVPVNAKDEGQMELATAIYRDLNGRGIETVLDDRNERPGVKFKDADLIGYPVKITIGPKTINEARLEVKVRRSGVTHYLSLDSYSNEVADLLKTL